MEKKTLEIGNLKFNNNIATAPMAGFTDRAFRDVLRSFGAELVFTEMLSDKALCYGNKNTEELLDIENENGIIAAQLVGGEAKYMADAARILEQKGVDLIDINMGCPVPKVVKNFSGSHLLTDLKTAEEIIKAVVNAVSVPVTVKMRTGFTEDEIVCNELVQIAENSGAKAVTLHGRTRSQFYSGTANWEMIREAREKVSIPFFANGDVFNANDYKKCLAQTNADGIMVARGILGNPWLVSDCIRVAEGKEPLGKPEFSKVMETAIFHLTREVELSGEYMGIRKMRAHLPFYLKGMRGAAQMRNKLNQLDTFNEVKALLEQAVLIEAEHQKEYEKICQEREMALDLHKD